MTGGIMVVLSPPVSPVQFTYEDFLLFPNDGKRHELIEGDHCMSPSPKTTHQDTSGNLFNCIKEFLKRTHLGRVFAAPYDVVFSDVDVVEPDLVYVSAARSAIITEDNIQGAPDLVVEILSPSSRKTDEIIKRKLYERYGVAEYWIVDPELETVKVYRFVEGRYARVAELARETGATLASPQFPGLTIPLDEIFG
jgi:Uma2 family endonuclease